MHFRPQKELNQSIKNNVLNLASLVSFLLLEEAARLKSHKWDENGKVFNEIPKTLGLTKEHSNGKITPHAYKSGQTIVSLAHKLYLLKLSLGDQLQKNIDGLDNALRKPMFPGDEEFPPLFERLESIRDRWMHGRDFDGWEGIFISLFLCIIYFEPSEQEIRDFEQRQ